jgi:hypothetical protein
MEAFGPLDPRYLPEGLNVERSAQWCLSRTLRDFRLSVSRQRTISLPNLLRLYDRRRRRMGIELRAINGHQTLRRAYRDYVSDRIGGAGA